MTDNLHAAAIEKCARCKTRHAPDDQARCDNAYELGIKLNRALNIALVACPAKFHEGLKGDLLMYLFNTEPTEKTGEHDANGEWLMTRQCIRCGGSVTVYLGSTVARESVRGKVRR